MFCAQINVPEIREQSHTINLHNVTSCTTLHVTKVNTWPSGLHTHVSIRFTLIMPEISNSFWNENKSLVTNAVEVKFYTLVIMGKISALVRWTWTCANDIYSQQVSSGSWDVYMPFLRVLLLNTEHGRSSAAMKSMGLPQHTSVGRCLPGGLVVCSPEACSICNGDSSM